MHDNPSAFLRHIEEMAAGAGAILMKHFRNLSGIEKKGEIDLVTIADKESEEYLVGEILRRFPDHAILGEEGGKRGNESSPYLWILDPVDGTTNYAHGFRIFAVSIGLTYKGEPIAGGVLAPAMDELYLAARGNGATCNGKPLRVSTRSDLKDALIVTGFPYERSQYRTPLMGMMGESLANTRGVLRLGAAAYDFAMVAAGILDAFYEWGLRPWDMAAGVLLVTEAGGRVSGLLPAEHFDLFQRRVVVTNGLIHDEMLRLLEKGGAGDMPGGSC